MAHLVDCRCEWCKHGHWWELGELLPDPFATIARTPMTVRELANLVAYQSFRIHDYQISTSREDAQQ